MLKLEDLVLHANADVYFSIHNTEGSVLIEGDRNDLENDVDMNLQVDDYWIDDDVLYVHVLQEGEI